MHGKERPSAGHWRPDSSVERTLWSAGYSQLAGIDEVGRGAWAGPVVAAAVILPTGDDYALASLSGVRDSKALSPRQREVLLPVITQVCAAMAIGLASSSFIDHWGIVAATRRAMHMAVARLGVSPDYLLIDALALPALAQPQTAIVHGDASVLSIASASIVAKVFRDRLMSTLDAYWPGYDFARNKGYGVARHRMALNQMGPCPAHRWSFAPLRQISEETRCP